MFSSDKTTHVSCNGNHQSFNDVNEHFICSLFLCNQNNINTVKR